MREIFPINLREMNTNSFNNLKNQLNAPRIPALDAVRTFAVSLVLFYHFGFEAVPAGQGVMMFFVLSGFLITWLLLKENESTGTVALLDFYRRRTLRIFPAFYVYWTLCVGLLWLCGKTVPWTHAWSSFFYVGNYYSSLHHHSESAFSHTWSLAIEEQFYLLWPLLFIFWRKNLAGLKRGLIALIGAIWIYRAALCLIFNVDESYIYSAFETRVDHLLIGCLVAVLLRQGTGALLWEKAIAHPVMPLMTAALLLLSNYFGMSHMNRYRDVIGFIVSPLLLALLMVQLIGVSDSKWWRWTSGRIFLFLGKISYPLYLYQQVSLFEVKKVLSHFPEFLQAIGGFGITVVLATFSYYLVERPFLKLKERKTKRIDAVLAKVTEKAA